MKGMWMNDNIFIVGVDMDNRPAERIAREAALKIVAIMNQLEEKQKAEKGKEKKP